jgi:hypothetical protein
MGVIELWWLSLAIAAVVVVVVAVLLGLIIATAKSIDRNAAAIWTVGKNIAGNTVSIWILEQIDDKIKKMGDSATSLVETAGSIDEKLRFLLSSSPGRR